MSISHRTMRNKVDGFIDYVSKRNVSHFYLETISTYTKLPIVVFADYVFQLVEWEELIVKYELRCPEYECSGRTVYDVYEEIPFNEYIEDYRGHEVFVEKDIIVPFFEIPRHLKKTGGNHQKKFLVSSPMVK
ncbi:hypothetical protein IHC39_002764 [Enterococcus faecalis]|uniref:hypothetical protein n=1 Tax=Enterococcus TaxID=1350 RepID=UPI00032F7015|nr:hypothetical protein [Enterococcus faecalis]EGO2586792.1 hypothetical protein [Enterococcus faecalis]EGO2588159.1 hypothetical protein [Enterococcus faecalis]EGO5850898.1 hypothetical protein [Enterococcus faecalis]EJI7260520.1 hypothetical protein [Enterococcus faecalis]EOJ53959.1 hypothetical protein WMI_02129 [Enterococcus faecalis EnGen0363]